MAKNCTYIIEGVGTLNSYTDLLNYLDNVDISSYTDITDVVYSKYARRDDLHKQLKTLSKNYVTRKRKESESVGLQVMMDGEPLIRESGVLSIQEFLDCPACNINGKALLTQMNTEDFINSEIRAKTKEGLSDEQATKYVENIIKNWNIIEEDSIALHSLFTSSYILNKEADLFTEDAKKIITPRLDKNTVLLDNLHHQLRGIYLNITSQHKDSKVIKNLNIKAALNNLDKDIVGHIDYLFIDKRGVLHLYNFKTSSTNPSEWQSVKHEKYKYQLVFLKQILANNGIYVKDISLNIIPVQLDYNEDFTRIKKISVKKINNYNLNNFGPALTSLEYKARHFIQDNSQIVISNNQGIIRANQIINNVFPTLNVKSDGINKSVEEWIKHAPTIEGAPLVIRKGTEHAYDVIINDKIHHIDNEQPKHKNKDIYELVKSHVSELFDNRSEITTALKTAIDQSIDSGKPRFDRVKGFNNSSQFLSGMLSQYIQAKGEKKSDWELKDEFLDQNLVLFVNKKTKQLDVISLSTLNLNSQANIKDGTNNLLGAYYRDVNIEMLNGDYGNIETIRSLILLNEVLPNLGDVKVGTIKVISPIQGGMQRSYNIEHISKKYLPIIFKTAAREDIKITNNFKYAEFVDPIKGLLAEYNAAIETKSTLDANNFGDTELYQALESADSNTAKAQALEAILTQLHEHFKDYTSVAIALKETHVSPDDKARAKIYVLASQAYHTLKGENFEYQKDLASSDLYMYTAPTVPDQNIRIVVNNLQTTLDTIASEIEKIYNERLREIIMDYYKDINYSSAQNAIIGNQASVYTNLYESDLDTGKRTMTFKNPYDPQADLNPAERKFLKRALYEFYYIRTLGNPRFRSTDEDLIIKHIERNPSYLEAPLIRASNATRRSNVNRYKSFFKNVIRIAKNPKQWYDEFVENLLPEEREQLNTDMQLSKLSNNFIEQQQPEFRTKLLENHGAEFFEVNVENMLIDYLSKYVEVEQMNKFLVGTKSLLVQLHLMGENSGNSEVFKKEVKYIKDYIKKNVFRTSIMEENSQKVVGALQSLRTAVTHANLAGNIVSYFRDNMNGFLENFMRAIIKFQTDLTIDDVRRAYQYVVPNSINNAMNVNILSKLCVKYRLSNTDLARISERLKTNRGGIFNADNWAYATLRSPDFMNRMVLFVAKCMHDGCWEAYSIENDTLVYNWKKDKRFEIYASGNKNHTDYIKQKSLYLSKVREWNLEHPTNPIEMDENGFYNLPSPYTDKEILSIKNVANNIYGSYDKSLKSMGENVITGWVFGMYTTWMNGIWNNWLLKPGQYNISQRTLEQERDENNKLLFFDENGGVVTEDELPPNVPKVPVMKHVPMLVQGIWYTLKDMFYICKDDGVEALKQYIEATPSAKQNLLKGLSDLLMYLFWLMLFKLIFDDQYKDYKKEMKHNPVLANLAVEVLYKSSGRMYDSFSGPLNIIEYFGENTNPPIYQVPIKVITDSGKWIFGEKTFGQLLTGNISAFRAYRDTYKAYTAE